MKRNSRPTAHRAIRKVATVLGCLLILAFALTANAQTFVSQATTTTLWGGSQNVTQFGFSGFTAPSSGVILPGTAISAFTGKPVRHIWYGDPINGLCRIDPEVDNPQATPLNGIGSFNVNVLTCLASIQKTGFNPGEITYDSTSNNIYTEDTGRTNAGVARLHYIPTGDNGNGSLDLIHVDSLVGTQGTRNAFGGCPQLKDPHTGSPVPVVPDAVAIGPDGNLYFGDIRNGSILRVIGPVTFNTQTDCVNAGDTGQNPNAKLQIPILSADERFGSGHTFGLGWIGHTLFGADNIAPWILQNADQCLTPINGNRSCASPVLGGTAPMPTEILAAQAGAPQAGLVSDSVYPTFGGNVMYVASFPNLTRVTNVTNAANMTVNLNYGGTFSFITGIIPDPIDPNNATVYVGADPSQGGINGSGQIWKVTPVAPAPGPPAAPVVTNAVAGPGTGQATVTWAPTLNGQPITTYVVQTLLASLTGGPPTPSTVPNVTVTAPTTTTTISGLTVGTAYVFEVQACNANGCSPFSGPSATVTAFAVTVPPAPTNVVGVDAGNGSSAAIAWTQASNGNSAITSSTINTFLGATLVSSTTVLGSGTGGTVTGLTCGNSYTFTVAATNAVGTGPASTASAPVTIACVTAADVSVTMSSPATINPGSILTYTISIHNGGPASAPVVQFSETLPAPLSSFTTTQGVCAGTAGLTAFNCNLGSLALGATATVTVSVQLPAAQTTGSFTNSVTVTVTNTAGVNIDPNLANNTASSTTSLTGAGGGCTATTTDIQTGGSSNNGNPVHNTPVTFTWQVKDNQGTIPANCSTFTASTTAPAGDVLTISAANPSQGTCTITANQVSCNLGNIAGGTTATITVTASPSAAAPANSYSMTGSATFTGTDTNTANNSFTVFIGAQ